MKSLCIVSGSLHFFFSFGLSISCLTVPYGRRSSKRRAKGLASFCFLAVPSASPVCGTLPAGARGVQVQLPHIPRTHFWVPLRGPSSSQAQVPTLSTLSSGYRPLPQVLAPLSLLCPFWRLPWESGPRGRAWLQGETRGVSSPVLTLPPPPQVTAFPRVAGPDRYGGWGPFLLSSGSGASAGTEISTMRKTPRGAVSTMRPAHGRKHQITLEKFFLISLLFHMDGGQETRKAVPEADQWNTPGLHPAPSTLHRSPPHHHKSCLIASSPARLWGDQGLGDRQGLLHNHKPVPTSPLEQSLGHVFM